ncbi:MAG: ECF transporter S component [Firmicutes bacterium]|nr:ECF transporter S component [Bacillota bacterium]
MKEQKFTVRELTTTAIVAALVFLMTYSFKIPTPTGYTHLGDCMIFIGVLILGTRKGALAGGIGAALSDALGGYTEWVIPTFFIKAIMAVIMGIFVYKLFKNLRFNWLIGAFIGGIAQVGLYALVKIPLKGMAYVMVSFPTDVMQTVFGIVFAGVIIGVLNQSGIIAKLRLKQSIV